MTAEEAFFAEVAARREMVNRTHPILRNKNDEIRAGPIPLEMALAYRLEERDILTAKMAVNEAEIKILRDCAPAQAQKGA